MPRTLAGIGVRKTISVGVEDVLFSITVQITQADPAAAVVLVRRPEHDLVGEVTPAVIFEEIDFLPLLRHERRDVQGTVAVEIGHEHIDRAREVQQVVALELSIAHVFHPTNFALIVSKMGDRQVEFPITVEIASAHIGHTRHVFEQHVLREVLLSIVLQYDH